MVPSLEALQQRLETLERSIGWQRRAVVIALVSLAVVGSGRLQGARQTPRFTELTVERLNIVEPNGQLVLAMANTDRLPEPILDGKTVSTGRKGPGMIFFNGKGWEVGGLIYGTQEDRNSSYAHFSFDQFHNDQVVYLHHESAGAHKTNGLFVIDRGAKFGDRSAQRVFVGSSNETAIVRLRDLAGRDRIRMSVDRHGAARLEFLDGDGNVVERLPK